MSLLTICQRVSDAVNLPRPITVINATDSNARRLLVCAREEIRQLVRRGDWQELVKQATFTLEDETADYPLSTIAADLGRVINGSEWNRTFKRSMEGPLSPQERQGVKAWDVQPSIRRKFWITGNVLTIWPTPSVPSGGTGDTIALEYVSKYPVASASGTAQEDWQADTDVGLLDEYLIELGIRFRFLKSVGMDFAEAQRLYEEEASKHLARGGGAPVLSLNSPARSGSLTDPGRDNVNWTTISIPAGQL